MNAGRLAGIAILAVGVVLLIVGFRSSEAPVDQISNALTGRYTDRTMWYMVGGAVAAVVGGVLAVLGKRL
ncbi:MAG: DUF3185 family protein [Alphaproteobacteria bacterium]|nr:DUF3185 family protein [Alphaproteobacteria bacterium]